MDDSLLNETADWQLDDESRYRFAVVEANLDALRALFAAGVPVDAPWFGHGATALNLAAGQDPPVVMQLLLDMGADVNAQDWEGTTPLLNAVCSGLVRNVAMLLDHGANPMAGSPPFAALAEARELGDPAIVALIERHTRGPHDE